MEGEASHPYHKLLLPEGCPYELRPSPGKGWGVFATAPIEKGTIVLEEEPYMFFRGKLPEELTSSDLWRAFVFLNSAPVEQWELVCLNGDPDKPLRSAFEEVLNQNRFKIIQMCCGFSGTGYNIIAGRFNHACKDPNLKRVTPDPDQTICLVAIKDIPVDAELVFTYKEPAVPGVPVDLMLEFLTQAQRNDFLGFACCCEMCATGSSGNELLPDDIPDVLNPAKLYAALYRGRGGVAPSLH